MHSLSVMSYVFQGGFTYPMAAPEEETISVYTRDRDVSLRSE